MSIHDVVDSVCFNAFDIFSSPNVLRFFRDEKDAASVRFEAIELPMIFNVTDQNGIGSTIRGMGFEVMGDVFNVLTEFASGGGNVFSDLKNRVDWSRCLIVRWVGSKRQYWRCNKLEPFTESVIGGKMIRFNCTLFNEVSS